jgi:hypothetical protein
MNKQYVSESALLILVSAVLYWAGFELQGWLFSFTEHIPGVNWFYLPSGLRVLLVMVAGAFGATGIFLATILIDLLHMPDIRGAMMLATALASGFGAWIALWVLRWKGVISAGLTGLTTVALLQFALLFSIFNALFHQTVWLISNRNGSLFMVDVWPMFVGDLLGATAFLYGLKLALRLKKARSSDIDLDLSR